MPLNQVLWSHIKYIFKKITPKTEFDLFWSFGGIKKGPKIWRWATMIYITSEYIWYVSKPSLTVSHCFFKMPKNFIFIIWEFLELK